MPEGFDNFELAAVVSVIRSYENVTGLSAQQIGHDSGGIFINWLYADGTWAGTTCYEMPLTKAVEKLQREYEAVRGQAEQAVA